MKKLSTNHTYHLSQILIVMHLKLFVDMVKYSLKVSALVSLEMSQDLHHKTGTIGNW